jgi:hypothetical protein
MKLSHAAPTTTARDSGTVMNNRRWLRRFVRRLVVMLFGYHNFVNLYHKNHATKQIEAYAKKRGLKVITFRRVGYDAIHMVSGLDVVVYPLPKSKQKHTNEAEENILLRDKIKLEGQTSDSTATANRHDCVPPLIKLKPGEWITHMVINAKPPNEKS